MPGIKEVCAICERNLAFYLSGHGPADARVHVDHDAQFCLDCWSAWPPTLIKALSVQGSYELYIQSDNGPALFQWVEAHSRTWAIVHFQNASGEDDTFEVRLDQIVTAGPH
ncbi:MAG TPA: hypothetical protein VGS96_13125 [Thermoanaerobaculia bacterium]|jgi:hypothetical protein|nr:hypothetical protein [Thermoanaerobaculia bacterium]